MRREDFDMPSHLSADADTAPHPLTPEEEEPVAARPVRRPPAGADAGPLGPERVSAAPAAAEEARLARAIQQRLFPAAPWVSGLDIGGASYPAASTGGDYFDFLPLPDGSLGVVIGDVCGHGFGPALLMASTRAYLRALAQTHPEPTEILTRANRVLVEDTGG